MTTTNAEKTLIAAIRRAYDGRGAKASTYRRLHEHLDPDENVLCVSTGYDSYVSKHLLVLTDRRVLLAKEPFPGRWKILRDVPAGAVVGVATRSKGLGAACLEADVRGESPVSLKIGNPTAAGELEQTLSRLLQGGGAGGR